jgi:hypothetical protein
LDPKEKTPQETLFGWKGLQDTIDLHPMSDQENLRLIEVRESLSVAPAFFSSSAIH